MSKVPCLEVTNLADLIIINKTDDAEIPEFYAQINLPHSFIYPDLRMLKMKSILQKTKNTN